MTNLEKLIELNEKFSKEMVFEWDDETKKTGEIIGQYSGSPNGSLQHVLCTESLLQGGELDDEEEREDD